MTDWLEIISPLLGRWHADRSLGLDEERQTEGRLWRAADARRRAQCRSGLPWPERSNDSHASTTDPDARLYRKGKGKETKLCFIGHGLMENRHGLLVDACLTQADGHAERVAALHMIEPHADRPTAITLGADKAYDAEDFVNELRSMKVTAHVAQNTSGRSPAIDGRTTRHGGYAVSHHGSAGSRRSPGKKSPGSVAVIASDGLLPSLPPPTIWCGSPS